MKKFKNKFGIEINICCASCQFKDFDNKLGERICSITGAQVDSRAVCEDWHLRQGLENAGAGGGTVKSAEHLREVFANITSLTD